MRVVPLYNNASLTLSDPFPLFSSHLTQPSTAEAFQKSGVAELSDFPHRLECFEESQGIRRRRTK